MKEVNVTYEGRVQGVGFRFTVMEVAARFEVVGYVQNQWDGTVYLVAQGSQKVVGEFL